MLTPSYLMKGLQNLLGFQDVKAPRLPIQSAHEGDKAVSLTHRTPLPPSVYPWFS